MAEAGGYEEYQFVAEYYDYVAPYRDREDVVFFVDAAIESGGPVLEVGSGTGRVLIPTARAGINIVGLDLSAHMLSVCRRNLQKEPIEVRERVELIQADMRQFGGLLLLLGMCSVIAPFANIASLIGKNEPSWGLLLVYHGMHQLNDLIRHREGCQ